MADRIERLEDHVFGTPENGYRDGMSAHLSEIGKTVSAFARLVNWWALAIMAVIFGTGIVNGKGAETAGAFLKGLFGQ